MPPANTTNMVDNQQEIGCLRENASAPTKHCANVKWRIWTTSYGAYICTWTEIVAYVQGTEDAVRHIEIRIHLPFGHLAGKLQKRFGVHFVQFAGELIAWSRICDEIYNKIITKTILQWNRVKGLLAENAGAPRDNYSTVPRRVFRYKNKTQYARHTRHAVHVLRRCNSLR